MLDNVKFTFRNLNEDLNLQKSQIQRLKKDSKQLEHYIHRLQKKGKETLAHKIALKNEYINQHISEMETLQ